MPRASATLTVWASAWLHGSAAPDDVIDALHAWAELHEVVAADADAARLLDLPLPDRPRHDLTLPDRGPTSVVGLLGSLRRAGAEGGRLLLPVPGDVRGLPPDGTLTRAALSAGEVALLGDGGTGPGSTPRPGEQVPVLAVVPAPVAEGVLRWTVFAPVSAPPVEEPLLSEAEHGLRGAVRQAATALVDLDVARHRPGVRAEIAETLGRRVRPPWPQGSPGRALRVLEQADEVEAILRAAEGDEPGAALSASAAAARSSALRPLFTAVREARRSAVGEAVRVLTPRAGRR